MKRNWWHKEQRLPSSRRRLLLETLEDRTVPAILVVTSNADSGAGSLRTAIDAANASAGVADTIVFDLPAGQETIAIASNSAASTFGPTGFVISDTLTIQGDPNEPGVTLDGLAQRRLFAVNTGVTLTLDSLTLTRGLARGGDGGDGAGTTASNQGGGGGGGGAGLGGAIFNQGVLCILNSTLHANQAVGGNGGAAGTTAGPSGGGGGGSAGDGGDASGMTGGAGGTGGGGQGGGPSSPADGGFGGGGGGGQSAGPGASGGFGGGGGGAGNGNGAFTVPGGPGGFGAGAGGDSSGTSPRLFAGAGGGGAGLGGAVFNLNGQVTIVNSTLTNNRARGGTGDVNGRDFGGALFTLNGNVTITSSTLAGNRADDGGAVFNLGHEGSGGVTSAPATLTLLNSILADSISASDLANQQFGGGAPAATVHATTSLVETGGTAINGTSDDNIVGQDPALSGLAANGGPTPTMALAPNSVAVLVGTHVLGVNFDQRGVARGLRPDLGAFQNVRTYAIAVNNSGQGLQHLPDVVVPELGAQLTLRDALNAARNTGGTATIQLQANATYTFDVVNGRDNFWYGPTALPAISSTVTIEGNGATIQRDPLLGLATSDALRFFFVSGGLSGLAPGTLTLRNLTLQNGLAKGGDSFMGGAGLGAGGAIFNQGTVHLDGVTLTNNTALGGSSTLASGGTGGAGMGQDAQGNNGGGFGGPFPGGAGGTGGTGAPPSGGSGGGGGFNPGQNGADGSAGTGGGLGGLGGSVGGSTAGDGGEGGRGGGNGASFGSGALSGGGGGGVGGGGGGDFPGSGGTIRGGSGGFGGGGAFGPLSPSGAGGFGAGGGARGSGGFGGGNSSGGGSGGAGAGLGGAVFNHRGTLAVTGSTLAANTARGGDAGSGSAAGGLGAGGAVFNLNGTVAVLHSTLAGNTVVGGLGSAAPNGQALGGALYNLAFGSKIEDGSTSIATTTLIHSILADSVDGGGSPVPDLVNHRFDPTPGNPNVATVDATAANIVELVVTLTDGAPGPSPITGNPNSADPQLGPLQNNGGPTRTMAIPANSPAFNAGANALAAGLTFDQRGPGFARLSGAAVDLGAFEVQLPAPEPPAPGPRVQSIRLLDVRPTPRTLAIQVVFNRAVTGLDRSDFRLDTRGGVRARIVGVTGSGTEYQVQVKLVGGQGRLRLRLRDDNSITDDTGALLGGPALGDGNFLGPLLRVRSLFTGLFEVGLAVARKR